jgi:ribosomal protein L29
VLKATQRSSNTAQFGEIRRDIARIKTIVHERELRRGRKAGITP